MINHVCNRKLKRVCCKASSAASPIKNRTAELKDSPSFVPTGMNTKIENYFTGTPLNSIRDGFKKKIWNFPDLVGGWV